MPDEELLGLIAKFKARLEASVGASMGALKASLAGDRGATIFGGLSDMQKDLIKLGLRPDGIPHHNTGFTGPAGFHDGA